MPTTKRTTPPAAVEAEPAPPPPPVKKTTPPPPPYDVGEWCGHPQFICRVCGRTFLDDEQAAAQHAATDHQPERKTGYVEGAATKGA